MVRVTNGMTRQRRHKKYRAAAKGFRLGRKNVYKQIRLAIVKQGENAYVDRRKKKRDFRKLWIERLSGALRQRGTNYSTFMGQMGKQNITLNRKVMSNIAIVFPAVFDSIHDQVMS